MRYWVYINDKVEGPFTDDKLVTLPGFTPDTLICSEDAANSGNQEWVKASSVFEFDQVAPQQEAPATQQETAPAANNEWASVLLARLDNLTNQLTDLQTKMDGVQSKVDGMQTKLDESIAAQQKAAQEESDRVAALASQMSQLSKPVENPADAALLPETSTPDTIEPDVQSNPTAESDDPNALFEVPGTIDLDPENSTESADTNNEDDMVLNAALTSLSGREGTPFQQPHDEKEDTFEDLLTPAEAQTLQKDIANNEEKPAEATADNEAQKEAVLAEFSSTESGENVVDQVIKEKEEEKKQQSSQEDTETAEHTDGEKAEKEAEPKAKKSISSRLAGLAEAAATFVGLKSLKKSQDKQADETNESGDTKEEPKAEGEELSSQETATAQEDQTQETEPADEAATPLEETPQEQTLENESQDLSTHQEEADIQLEPKSEEEPPVSTEPQDTMDLEALLEQDPPKPVDPSEQGQDEDPAPLADLQVISTAEEQPEQKTEESADEEQELPHEVAVNATMTATPYLPALDAPEKTPAEEQEEAAQQTVEELVPGAKTEQPDSIITEEDLREAFTEHNSQNNSQSVEQLFGLASAAASANALAEKDMSSTDEQENMPSLSEISSDTPAEKAMPEGDPEKVTDEIELKEGSTYLISDFVPPASSSAMRQAYEAKENPDKAAEDAAREANGGKDEPLEIQEMITEPQGDLPQAQENNVPTSLPDAETTPENTEGNLSSELTVSQIVLENTIKAKRGASLDIKTVPMVPDPAKSERLQLEDINDINTQHDLKSADIQPAGRTAKLVVGTLIALLLAAVIYAMLGFMDLIPAKFNIFNSQATAEAEQQAQLNEVLPVAQPEESAVAALPGNLPTVTVEDTTAPTAATLPPTTQDAVLSEVQNYRLANGYTLKQYIEKKHPAMVDLITWSISNAVDPDNYSVLAKVPPENPQSFKISYRFNYNAVTKTLEPTISDARNLLESVNQSAGR